MKRAAIYARYSSENQRRESIDDQISSCQKYAVIHGYNVEDANIFTDEATSGARVDRKGLDELIAASGAGRFDIVLVDDLSRLARDNYLMLTKLAQLHFNGVSVISIADGLDTNDKESKLAIQIRGIFNELQLDDLRKKTLRGQKGQKERGFFVGESTYGYRSIPFGEVRMDKKGRPRPEGYRMEIEPGEAAIILRIFNEFSEGRSKSEIVRRLNKEGVPGRFKSGRGWSPSTITRMLNNTKYVGRWIWNKLESRKDPQTGRLRRFPKPESEWHVHEDENLRIIPQELWDKVQKRLEETRRTWPGGKSKRGFENQNGSRVVQYPRELLSGSMVCGVCGGAVGKRSGKAGGYYGCINAGKEACDNKTIVRRTIVEKIILSALSEKLNDTENIAYILKRVEENVKEMHSEVPETIRLKELEFNAEQRHIDNFVAYIAEGRSSEAVGKALEAAERRVNQLAADLTTLKASKNRLFKAPPPEWIKERITTLQEVLERRVGRSALILRKVLGKIVLEPVQPEIGKSYLRARCNLQALALIEIEPDSGDCESGPPTDPEGGSNSLRWWRRWESNPRPKASQQKTLHAYPLFLDFALQAPSGRGSRIAIPLSSRIIRAGRRLMPARFIDAPHGPTGEEHSEERAAYLGGHCQVRVGS